MTNFKPKAILLLVSVLAVFPIANPTFGQVPDSNLEELCEKLEDLRILDAFILSASIVKAEEDIPEHCLVVGYTLPSNHFEIRLPTNNWNGKFFLAGCGGACGRLPVNINGPSKIAIGRGYAIATMDTGHWGSGLLDWRWAYNNQVAEIDWAYRAVHQTATVSKVVVKAFFDQEPAHSYFWGCSNGGRQGLMEAIKFPKDFDGIISEAPGISMTGVILLFNWISKQNTGKDGIDIIKPSDVPIIVQAVYEKCDAIDGLEDGLIRDPRKCQFDPVSLLCGSDDQTDCLSKQQVEVLQAFYEGPVNSAGDPLLPSGLPFSSEPFWWWYVGQTDRANDHPFHLPDLLRYIYFKEDPGPNYNPATDFNYDIDPPKSEYMGNILNADSPALENFKEAGGKILMFQGWSDPAVPYETTIGYYNEVENRFGGKRIVQDFFRLFMIPGMDHCSVTRSLGITAESLDPLTALENWIEKGDAPVELPVTRFDDNGDVLSHFSVSPFSENNN